MFVVVVTASQISPALKQLRIIAACCNDNTSVIISPVIFSYSDDYKSTAVSVVLCNTLKTIKRLHNCVKTKHFSTPHDVVL